MAREFSTSKRALSYIERRINWVNRTLDANLDVKSTMAGIIRGREAGEPTTLDRTLSALGDLRRAETRESTSTFLRYAWNDLALQNNYVENVLQGLESGAYIGTDMNRIYVDVSNPGQVQWLERDMRTNAVRYLEPGTQPADAVRLTPQLANKVLSDYAKTLHDRQSKDPSRTSYREW